MYCFTFLFLLDSPSERCRIYRWSGTYMDVVDEVMTIGATSVTAFEHRQSTIIVFAQSNDENPRVGSEVYEFKDNHIVRIQFLATARQTSMHRYVHGDFNFVLMVNELGPSVVFCWDGLYISFEDKFSHDILKKNGTVTEARILCSRTRAVRLV